MARTWLSTQVELVHGHGEQVWPRPGRIFAAARGHTFRQLAIAIDTAFARWDRAHLHEFTLADQTPISVMHWWDGEHPDNMLDSDKTTLNRLKPGDQFAYVFDRGDHWQHLCTVADARIDPSIPSVASHLTRRCTGAEVNIPDQYQRRWNGDDGQSAPPKPPADLADLPPILRRWGPRR